MLQRDARLFRVIPDGALIADPARVRIDRRRIQQILSPVDRVGIGLHTREPSFGIISLADIDQRSLCLRGTAFILMLSDRGNDHKDQSQEKQE